MHQVQICTVCTFAPTLVGVTETDTIAQGTEPVGRRELNKARTREAIIDALATLVRHTPIHRITVDQLAEAAGISRRTFFNYCASIPAVVSEVIGEHTAHLPAMIDAINPGASPFPAIRDIVATVGMPRELIEWMAAIHAHGCQDEPAAMTFERMIWADKSAWLNDELRARLPEDVDELYVATLSGTIMNTMSAATQIWVARRDPQSPVTQGDIDDFNHQVGRALAFAESGWTSPDGNVAGD